MAVWLPKASSTPRPLWRLSRRINLDGGGGLLYPARWNTVGRRIVYLADSPAGAMLEALVHLELGPAVWPRDYQLLAVPSDGSIAIEDLRPPPGPDWKSDFAASRALGDQWLRRADTALARVPSAILPHTWNYLLNPLHPAAAALTIAESIPVAFDMRLLRAPG